MVDRDIRAALDRELQRAHASDPETLVIDELGICQGEARIDLAVINGAIAGFEIKSDRDTLARLPRQAELYGRVFDYVTLVVGGRYRDKVEAVAPPWWGITLATPTTTDVSLQELRPASRNHDVDPCAVVQLLWRDEALEILEEHDLAAGVRSKPRRDLWRRLVDKLPHEVLADAVRSRLRAREDWRPDPPLLPSDG
jgi:hypothetical protein